MKRTLFLLALIATLGLAAGLPMGNYQIDPSNAEVSFTIKNLGVEVEGSFAKPTGTVVFEPNDKNIESISASVQVRTIKTGIGARDESLLEEDYFHADKYSTIRFRSTSISQTDKGYQAKGTLTIKGISKTIFIPFTVEEKTLKGSFTIDRLDYQVGESSWILGDEVKIKFRLPVTAV